MDPLTIAALAWAGLSTLGNIWQGITQMKLQKKIEVLTQIIIVIENQIDKLKKELEAQRSWNLYTKAKLKKEIKNLKKTIAELQHLINQKDENLIDDFLKEIEEN